MDISTNVSTSQKAICISCNKKPVVVKKRQLCATCYQKERKTNIYFKNETVCRSTYTTAQNNGEVRFALTYKCHGELIHHPAIFKLSSGAYTPDFYDAHTNTFIEVTATPQAYQQNKHKYEQLRCTFPQIKFEIRRPNGALLEFDKHGRAIWE